MTQVAPGNEFGEPVTFANFKFEESSGPYVRRDLSVSHNRTEIRVKNRFNVRTVENFLRRPVTRFVHFCGEFELRDLIADSKSSLKPDY